MGKKTQLAWLGRAPLPILLVLTVALSGGVGQHANASLIDFESDAPGLSGCSHGACAFTSADEPHLLFESGDSMEIGDFGIASHGRALKVLAGGTQVPHRRTLNMVIPPGPFGLLTEVSLDFGNDDPRLTRPGDLAMLEVLMAGNIVGRVTKELNRDTAMNQRIEFSGADFARIQFAYVDPNLQPIQVQPVIDNIKLHYEIRPSPIPIPEPGLIALLGFGLAGLGIVLARRHFFLGSWAFCCWCRGDVHTEAHARE